MDSPEKSWLGAFLYYAEPWEQFLVEAVKPFVESILDAGLAEQFFFIRYWERGPHIRLRFKGDKVFLEKELKPKLNSHFLNYFGANPSPQIELDWVHKLPSEQSWFPNNSIQYIPYEPEIERYGGPTGILIAERQFQFSSRIVLDVIEECDSWSYARALGAGIQLHLIFAHALGMDLSETTAFYSRLFENWFGWGLGHVDYEKKVSGKKIKQRRQETLKAFAEQFELQKSQLIPFHRTLWNAIDNNMIFEQDWLNHWVQGMECFGETLQQEQKAGHLIYPIGAQLNPKISIPKNRQLLWSILFSCVHMTNNRLGVLNRDEAYLGYLIKESLGALHAETPD